jgi:hypothetical protein
VTAARSTRDTRNSRGSPSESATRYQAELGAYALEVSQRSLPDDGREGIPFGPVTPAPAGAGVYARLAAWLGRPLPG